MIGLKKISKHVRGQKYSFKLNLCIYFIETSNSVVYFINYEEDTDIKNISNIIWKWVDSCHTYLRNTVSFLILLLLHILIYKSWNIFTCDFLFCIIIIYTTKLVFQLHLKCGHFIKVHGTPWKVAVMVPEHSLMCSASFWANF